MKIFHITVIAIIGYALAGAIGLGTLNLMSENNSLQNEIETLNYGSNLLYQSNNDQQIKINQISLELEELNQNYSILVSLHESISNDLESKLKENTQLSIDNDKWMTQAIELQNDHNMLILDHEALITDYSFLNETSNQQNIDFNQSQETNRLLNIDLNESNLKNDNLQEEISQIKDTNEDLQEILSSQQVELDEANAEIEELIAGQSGAILELETLRQQYNVLTDNYNNLINNYTNLFNANTALVDDYNSLVTDYNTLLNDKMVLEDDYNTLVTNYNTLFTTYNTLVTDYSTLVGNYNNLVNDFNVLLSDDTSLLEIYNELKVKYDLWRLQADLAPKARDEYSVIGYIPYAGEWLIEESAIFISFLDPENCVMLGNIAFTGSMRPAMHGGHTTIETTCFSNNDLQLGDIIVYDDLEGRNVIHQIIEIRPEGVITKGINNEVADPGMILWDDIISLVIAIIY